MLNQSPLATGAGLVSGADRRVFCTAVAPLRLADGTPLHLGWIIEGEDGKLYRVPAEPGGWLRRSLYEGRAEELELLPQRQAEAVVWLTYADTDALTRLGYMGYTQEDHAP